MWSRMSAYIFFRGILPWSLAGFERVAGPCSAGAGKEDSGYCPTWSSWLHSQKVIGSIQEVEVLGEAASVASCAS